MSVVPLGGEHRNVPGQILFSFGVPLRVDFGIDLMPRLSVNCRPISALSLGYPVSPWISPKHRCLDALADYHRSNRYGFTPPGHRQGAGVDEPCPCRDGQSPRPIAPRNTSVWSLMQARLGPP